MYVAAIAEVESQRHSMIKDLAALASMPAPTVVQWLAANIEPGRTFDETLAAVHAWNMNAFR